MIANERIFAPFTQQQCASLNGYQESGVFHPFTCGAENCRCDLVAKEDGWHCPSPGCEYHQDWAHLFMGNWSWLAQYFNNRMRHVPYETLHRVWELLKAS